MFEIQIEQGFSLELLHPCHAAELFALVDKNRDHLREWLPWLDYSKEENDTREFIKTTMKQYADGLGFQAAMVFKCKIVGVIGYHPLDRLNRSGGIGYWLDKQNEGNGLMTKALLKIIELGFGKLDLEKVTISCASENRKSRAVAERLGFKLDGFLRQNEWLYDHFVDSAVYSMLKSEFKSVHQ